MKSINSRFSVVVIVVTAAISLFSFQNCAPPKLANSFQSNLSSLAISDSSLNSSSLNSGICGAEVYMCEAGDLLTMADSGSQRQWSCVGSSQTVLCTSNNAPEPTVTQVPPTETQVPPTLRAMNRHRVQTHRQLKKIHRLRHPILLFHYRRQLFQRRIIHRVQLLLRILWCLRIL